MSAALPVTLKAQRTCARCRYRKQHCDKVVPSCSRCASKSLWCDYRAPTVTDVPLGVVPGGVDVRPSLIVERCTSCDGDITVLGSTLLLQAWQQPHMSDNEGADVYLASLVNCIFKEIRSDKVEAHARYFVQIHPWFPILHEPTFTQHFNEIGVRSAQSREFALLLLCTHLISSAPFCHPEHIFPPRLYVALKRGFFELQMSISVWHVELVQAGLLIALFECAHGLHHTAYLTLSSCLALAKVTHADCIEMLKTDVSAADATTIACWAILILDRVIWLSEPLHPFSLLIGTVPTSAASFRFLEEQSAASNNGDGELNKFRTLAHVSACLCQGANGERDKECVNSSSGPFETIDSEYTSLLETMLRLSHSRSAAYLCDATALVLR
ncbi:hypothetical protein FOWG_17424 [Fusarium oxysporum f. sp. lycopersici MN25]|nr:hypothetical protein FOWG_17424 [Fusarium oxysporum f. sp. lycopersici MN25]